MTWMTTDHPQAERGADLWMFRRHGHAYACGMKEIPRILIVDCVTDIGRNRLGVDGSSIRTQIGLSTRSV